jgi:MscS family membrane protein
MENKIPEKTRSIGERMDKSPALKTGILFTLAAIAMIIGLYTESSYLKATSVLVLALCAAQLVEVTVEWLIRRYAQKPENTLNDKLIGILHQPLFWSVILIGLVIAVSLIQVPTRLEHTVSSAVFSILVFLWMLFALRASRMLLRRLSRRKNTALLVSAQTLPLFTNLAAVVIVALGVYFIFQAWDIDMTAWLASAGIIGIAVGFAAKDTLANLFSGVFIMADSPYKLGDYVVIDDNVRGKITHMGIRSTRLLTRDDVEVTIPNSLMGNSKVVNESGGPYEKYRIRIRVDVAYGSDLEQVAELLEGIANSEPEVCETPEPRVRYRAFGGSGVSLELLAWVAEPELRGKVVHLLIMAIYKGLRQAGIEIPYSKQELFIKEMPTVKPTPTPRPRAPRKTTKH